MDSFQPNDSFRIKQGTLPHWSQDQATYFITFRLADSIPNSAFKDWKDHRNDWLRCQGINPHAFAYEELSSAAQKYYAQHFGKRFHQMLDDCFGSCILREPENGQIVADALRFFANERYQLGSFVVMPNHVHLIIKPTTGFQLSKILQSIKSHSAKEINRRTNQSGQLWQRESYDHIVRSERQHQHYRNYIRENPEKANLTKGFILSE